MNRQNECEIWKLYQKAQSYTAQIGLAQRIKQNIDFYEGNQWATPTEATKSMPRPVINLVKFICRNKRAMLTATPIRLVYKCASSPEKAKEFTDFAEYMQKEMQVPELDSQAIRDALLKGSYFYHLYWDSKKVGKRGVVEGGLRTEIIDPQNIFFANPQEMSEQKQEWIIISSAKPVRAVLEMADKDVDKSLIIPEYMNGLDDYCTVLTRYFRKNGEVYCEIAVKPTIVKKAFRISPLPENSEVKAHLYPIVAGIYDEKEKCIYGQSEAEGLISDQKLINHILGMQALAIQNTAWGKYVVTKDALRGQRISNEPGEILVDHSLTGNGIRKMEQHTLTGMPLNYVNNLTSMIRTVSGATEVITGETLIANMSGTAIAQLQNQANQPILDHRKRFWRTKERYGKVLEQCFRIYYDAKEFYKDDQKHIFNANDFNDLDLEITVEAVGGANGSTAGDISILEKLYQKGDIDAKTFIEAYPNDMILNKNSILDALSRLSKKQNEEEII